MIEDRKPHKVMTADEYADMLIIGWHEVCRDVDGFGGVGVRFLTEAEPTAKCTCVKHCSLGMFKLCAEGADEIQRIRITIRDSIEALERNSTSAPVVECLKAALYSDGRLSRGNANVGDRIGRTRRPAHPKDTISGGPIGPSEAIAEIIAAWDSIKPGWHSKDIWETWLELKVKPSIERARPFAASTLPQADRS